MCVWTEYIEGQTLYSSQESATSNGAGLCVCVCVGGGEGLVVAGQGAGLCVCVYT